MGDWRKKTCIGWLNRRGETVRERMTTIGRPRGGSKKTSNRQPGKEKIKTKGGKWGYYVTTSEGGSIKRRVISPKKKNEEGKDQQLVVRTQGCAGRLNTKRKRGIYKVYA